MTDASKKRRVETKEVHSSSDDDKDILPAPIDRVVGISGLGALVRRFLTFHEIARTRRVSSEWDTDAAPRHVFGTAQTGAKVHAHVLKAVSAESSVSDVKLAVAAAFEQFNEKLALDIVALRGDREALLAILAMPQLYEKGNFGVLVAVEQQAADISPLAAPLAVTGILHNLEYTVAETIDCLAYMRGYSFMTRDHDILYRAWMLERAAMTASDSKTLDRVVAVAQYLQTEKEDETEWYDTDVSQFGPLQITSQLVRNWTDYLDRIGLSSLEVTYHLDSLGRMQISALTDLLESKGYSVTSLAEDIGTIEKSKSQIVGVRLGVWGAAVLCFCGRQIDTRGADLRHFGSSH